MLVMLSCQHHAHNDHAGRGRCGTDRERAYGRIVPCCGQPASASERARRPADGSAGTPGAPRTSDHRRVRRLGAARSTRRRAACPAWHHVTLIDTNLLVYATFADAPEHDRAREWLEERLAEGEGTVALCWPVVYAFLRLVTSPRVFGQHAVAVKEGWDVATAYLEQPAVRLVVAGAGHRAIAEDLTGTPGLRSDDVPDIEIAALAIEHGLVLASHDHGFRRFSRLRVVDPLTVDST